MTIPLDPEQIATETARGILLFAEEFGRVPSKREMEMIAAAIIRHHLAPDAPTTRLQ